MSTASELWWQGRIDEIWKQCCGFIDLSIEDFMNIQRRLLLEQIQLLNGCELGRKVMRGARPRSVEEFRALVPFHHLRGLHSLSRRKKGRRPARAADILAAYLG